MLNINSNNATLKDSDKPYIEINDEPESDLHVTNVHLQQFTFTSSDKPIHHGQKWCPCLMLLCVESFFVYFGYLIVAIVLWVITIIIIFAFCIVENCHCCDRHIIEFNNNTRTVSLYTNEVLIKRISYDEFIRLHLKYEKQSYQYCHWFSCLRCEIGHKSYQTASVFVVLKSMEHIAGGVYQNKCYRINGSYGCYKNEIHIADDMVLNANKYWNLKGGNSDNVKLQLNDTHIQIKDVDDKNVKKYDIGSFCYVDSMDCNRVYNAIGDCDDDCDTVYGVIVDLMPGGYKIIDLFEERERFAKEKSVTLITEENAVKEVQMLLNKYRKNKGEGGQ